MFDALIAESCIGADEHLVRQHVKKNYWAQKILFPDGTSMDAQPSSGSDESVWWENLKSLLAQHPMFLTGPGGMGKTAFLAYLYEKIRSDESSCPYAGSFLLSLDTLISRCSCIPDVDSRPLSSDNSPLLQHIANRAEDCSESTCGYWREFFRRPINGNEKPVLLLLDGLSEMQSRQIEPRTLFQQILAEIAAISDKTQYPKVHVIVTSRTESDAERTAQLNSLPDYFQQAQLCGLQEPINITVPIKDQVKKLLERPMYRQHIQSCIEKGRSPTTQYQVLKEMYSALAEQMLCNVQADERTYYFAYILEFLLPILAYQEWTNNRLTTEIVRSSCIDIITEWTPLISFLASSNPAQGCGYQRILRNIPLIPKDGYEKILKEIRFYPQHSDKIINYLKQQQVLFHFEKDSYVFQHQDYRDFLVAEYFVQRMYYMCEVPDSRCWDSELNIRSLQINTYGKYILKLVYEAVEFPEKFLQTFLVHSKLKTLTSSDIFPGWILWYTVPYQLADMLHLVGISCTKEQEKRIKEDALKILRPLSEYAFKESRMVQQSGFRQTARPILALGDLLKQDLTEILMKVCELYREQEDYNGANRMIAAAKYLNQCKQESKNLMFSAIYHNQAMVDFHIFQTRDDPKYLTEALTLLYRCAVGNEAVPPYRFSCSLMGLLLASPHPKLGARNEFQDFLSSNIGDDWFVHAFWFYYSALFEERKKGETWITRIYPLRQLLYLLADYKIEVNLAALGGVPLEYVDIQNLYSDFSGGAIVEVGPRSSIPTKENLQLIQLFLKEIEFLQVSWYDYMVGMIEYGVKGNQAAAKIAFQKMIDKAKTPQLADTRSRLWKAFLDHDLVELERAHEDGLAHTNSSVSVTSYDVRAYYELDITALYSELKRKLSRNLV